MLRALQEYEIQELRSGEGELGVDLCQPRLPRSNVLELLLERIDLALERKRPERERPSQQLTTVRNESNALGRRPDLASLPEPVDAGQAEQVLVVLEQRRSVRDGDESCEEASVRARGAEGGRTH